jgi:hypothetical protein
VPSISDQLALSVGLDMAFDKHVSRANARKMKKIGLRVSDLPGLISYSDWARKRISSGGGRLHGLGRV